MEPYERDIFNPLGEQIYYIYSESYTSCELQRPSGWAAIIFPSDFNLLSLPEPTTMLLLGLDLVGVAGIRRKFKG
jgi:hypothetical protein